MIGLLIATIGATSYPAVWANDYCVHMAFGATHTEAVALATAKTGEPTERAWLHVQENNTWCADEQESERN